MENTAMIPRSPQREQHPPHEPSAWLRSAAARRLRGLCARITTQPAGTVVVAPLIGPVRPGSREDRRCDRCRRDTARGHPFYPFALRHPGRCPVVLVVGLCQRCAELEGLTDSVGAVVA